MRSLFCKVDRLRWTVISLLVFGVFAQPSIASLTNLIELSDVVVVARNVGDERLRQTDEQRTVILNSGESAEVKVSRQKMVKLCLLKGSVSNEFNVLTFDAVKFLIPFEQIMCEVPCMFFLKRDGERDFVFTDNTEATIPLRFWDNNNLSADITEVVRHELLRSMRRGSLSERLEAFDYAQRFDIMLNDKCLKELLEVNRNPLGLKILLVLYGKNKKEFCEQFVRILVGDEKEWQVEKQHIAEFALEARRLGLADEMSEAQIRRAAESSIPSVALLGYQGCFGSESLSLEAKLNMLFAALSSERPVEVRAYAVTKLTQLSGVDLGVMSYSEILNDTKALEESVRKAIEARQKVIQESQSRALNREKQRKKQRGIIRLDG